MKISPVSPKPFQPFIITVETIEESNAIVELLGPLDSNLTDAVYVQGYQSGLAHMMFSYFLKSKGLPEAVYEEIEFKL